MDTVIIGSSADETKAKNLQVIIDHNSRHVWAKATPKNTAEAIIKVLEDMFKVTGTSKQLLTDNGKNFRSKKFQKFLTFHKVKHLYTSTYHPQTNGANEKVNGTIVRGIRMDMSTHPRHKWSTLVKRVVDNYNQTIHSTTGFTPSYLMFGQDKFKTSHPSVNEARQQAKLKTDLFKSKLKDAYDMSHRPLNLSIGDLVKRRTPANHPDLKKMSPRYQAPFEVVSTPGPVNAYIRKYPDDNSNPFLVHISQLEPYFLRDPIFSAGEWEDLSNITHIIPHILNLKTFHIYFNTDYYCTYKTFHIYL